MAQRDLTVHLIGDSRSLERAFTRSSKAAKGFDDSLGRAGRGALAATVSVKGLGRALAFSSNAFLGGAGVAFAIKAASSAASNLAEQTTKTERVFGRSAVVVKAFAKDALGLANDQALQTASSIGALLIPLGISGKAAADLSVRLTQLGTDFASFFNTDTADALQAIQSGLVGEVEPLRRYGVLLSEARVQQEALSETGKRSVKQLTAQEKVQARVALIFRDSAQAQGDYARTQGGLANTQRDLAKNVRNLEIAIGTALNPTILEVTRNLNAWLSDTENQKRVQGDVAVAVKVSVDAIRNLAAVVQTASDAVGGFKNLLEILIGFKVATVLAQWTTGFTGVGIAAGEKGAAGKVGLLSSRLAGLNALTIAPIVIPIELAILDKERNFVKDKLGNVGKIGFDIAQAIAAGGTGELGKDIAGIIKKQAAEAPKPHSGVGFRDFKFPPELTNDLIRGSQRDSGLTAKQRNAFFDSALSRVLLRSGLGTIQQQIAGLQKANALIAARLKVTKDVTRRLNLEDQLLQNAAQIKDLTAQQAADALQKRQDAVGEFISRLQLGVTKAQATATFTDDIAALKALQAGIKSEINEFGNTTDLAGQLFDVQQQLKQATLSKLTAKQFRELGLTATGDEITPGVANLQKRLAQLSANVVGSSIDSPKLESQLSRFRKVLSEGLVPKDVRAKIRDMMNEIADELKNGSVNLTKFRHTNSNVILSGLGLSPDEIRRLRSRLSQIGLGGTVPSRRSAAFAGAGATPGITVNGGIHLHGVQDVRKLKNELDKEAGKRSRSRRGR